MPSLKGIHNTVQQVAEAISLAVGIETEIVDNELTIIGGTSFYKKQIGQKEECGKIEGNYLYARVLREGKTMVVKDAVKDPTYGESCLAGTTRELAEICTPIKAGGEIIGIIGLVAFKQEQQKRLNKDSHSMVLFVERMADLLGAKAAENDSYREMEKVKNEIMTILETIHEGMLAVDKKGYITYCNSVAGTLLKTPCKEIIGKHLSTFMPGTPALTVVDSERGYTEQEEIYEKGYGKLHFIVTAKPINGKEGPTGVVISFRDIIEAHKLVYNMKQRNVKYTFEDIIGVSDAITKVKYQALQVARGNSTVLITGESGTGKELFARAIHYASARQKGPFISVNCGAIPANLLESELFGYEKGAFTGAKEKGKAGRFEMADGGTIFLDEIGELPLQLQVKLLHVLQNKRFERVGGTKTITTDIRVIAATNRDLEEMIRDRAFREDLYYRLSVIPLRIPPLRERPADIPLLIQFFLKKYNAFMNKSVDGLAKVVEEIYCAYDWPGNVRELENAVEYGINMTFDDKIGIDAVPPRIRKIYNSSTTPSSALTLQDQLKETERDILLRKLSEYGSSREDKMAIARELNISRATLYRKLAEHKLL
ncbi:MAG: Response regulator of zinc sigma-54-dependent two-component system [Firmicutes bacterium]|nr:Response regulator of zinc sigma-54-dependent two-component system [Bacillota bacterium]MDI6706200.1 sigma 54-interacting transcriptional regulator [Bacillota bacterium]